MELLIGEVKHYFGKIQVAVISLKEKLSLGDKISFRNKSGEVRFEQTVESMEKEHQKINSAEAGEEVAIKVEGKVREGDLVYRELE